MNKLLPKIHRRITVKSTICLALILLAVASVIAGHAEVIETTRLADSAMQALKQQCVSFNRLVAADRTKSLYRLSDMMLDLSEDIERDPTIATDAYLENYVDSLRLSGVALLDRDGNLTASGYTRQFREADWDSVHDGSQFTDIVAYPQKIYTERVEIGGEYYDVCAVARRDTPGILVGFYHQPSGLVTNMENDLESLLSGLQLDRNGHYFITEDGEVRVASDNALRSIAASDNTIYQGLSDVPKDGKLHWIYGNGHHYWGYHSGCENYSIYIYYPATAVFSSTIIIVAITMAVYSILCLVYFAVRNQTLFENQEELRRSNHSLTQTVEMLKALETIYFSLFYVDLETGHYRTIYVAPWLKAAIPETGSYDALRKLFLDGFVVPAFREEIDGHMSISYIQKTLNQQNLTSARKSFYVDYQATRGNRTPWCRVSATPVDFDSSGNPLHVLALIQDIDKDKAREADYQAQILKEANEAKIANNAKNEFLRRISHDIRTPINGIQGYVDMANRHPEDAELQARCRKNIISTLHIVLELVNSIVEMGDLETNEIVLDEKSFDLNELLSNANTVLIPLAAEKSIHFEVLRTAPVPFPHLIGSPLHLSQVIMNLASNAVKYTPSGGHVQVDTQLIAHTDGTATYAFVCKDDGIGMSEEFQQHMYEPFAQEAVSARTTYEGVGLGLSIVKKLVDAMGGIITCQSQKNHGTNFHTVLTFKIDPSVKQTESIMEETQVALTGMHILLVEDNPLNMEIAECLLAELGAKITKAWNGKEAVNIFSASVPYIFNLILMDIMMPEMGGREAARTIRAMNRPDAKSVPIIAMSANSLQDDVRKNRDSGMNGHITKPVDPGKLSQILKSYVYGQE